MYLSSFYRCARVLAVAAFVSLGCARPLCADILCEKNGNLRISKNPVFCPKGWNPYNLGALSNFGISVVGPRGAKGEKGDKGDQGVPGIVGVTGPQGAAGPKGEVGSAGPTGPKGDGGAKGESNLSQVGFSSQITPYDSNFIANSTGLNLLALTSGEKKSGKLDLGSKATLVITARVGIQDTNDAANKTMTCELKLRDLTSNTETFLSNATQSVAAFQYSNAVLLGTASVNPGSYDVYIDCPGISADPTLTLQPVNAELAVLAIN